MNNAVPILAAPPTPSQAKARFNLITFRPDVEGVAPRIFLKLDGGWKRTAGLKPDINRAFVSYHEFAKLGGDANVIGTVEFWYTASPVGGTPDVALKGERIVAVEASGQGVTPDTATTGSTTYEYLVFFADFRERWVSPRGGRLEMGVFNQGPPARASIGPRPYNPDDDPATLERGPQLDLRDMINLCLAKMGSGGIALPKAVDGIDAPRDVKWFGNHAPTELEKLLSLCGCVLCPELDGTPSIQAMTNQGTPTFPAGEQLPTQSIPKVDRRGKYVVFSSYPSRAIGTQTDSVNPTLAATDSSLDWQFVCQDKAGNWVQLWKCDLITAAYPDVLTALRDEFYLVDPVYKERVFAQAMSCIRALQQPPAAVSPVLNRRFEADGLDYAIQVKAAIAVQSSGDWANAASPIEIAASHRNDQDVLFLSSKLIQIGSATSTTPFLYRNISGPAPFTVRYSYEMSQPLDVEVKGSNAIRYFPLYFHVGFVAGGAAGGVGGNVTQMSDDDVENAIDGNTGDAIILTRPQWRLLNVDGEDVNRDALVAKGQAEAGKYLADASVPDRICASRGFSPVAPSGLVTEVEWDQVSLKTTCRLADWFSVAGNLSEQHELRKEERAGVAGAETYPNQGITESTRTANFEAGATQPVLPISPQPMPPQATIGEQWGYLQYAWTIGTNQITVQPCIGPTDATPVSGSSPVVIYLQYPLAKPASWCGYAVNDIVGYVATGASTGDGPIYRAINNPPPAPTAQYQVIANANAGNPDYVADYVRAH